MDLRIFNQANYILNSVLENFKNDPEITAQAKEALAEIKANERNLINN